MKDFFWGAYETQFTYLFCLQYTLITDGVMLLALIIKVNACLRTAYKLYKIV